MNYTIDKNSIVPSYLQLYGQIKKDITDGVYPFGSKLPSKRVVSAETDVSVITAEHAYELLREEGYIEAKERSGYFVIYKTADFLTYPDSFPKLAVPKVSVNTVSGEFPFSTLSRKMRKVLSDYGERILVKSPNHGCEELRFAISAYLARSSGIKALPEQIIIGSGAEYLYSMVLQLLGSERVYALEEPSYEKIRRVYGANNIKYDMLKLGQDGIKTSELERTGATVLHVTPFNSFPSGISATASKRQEYISWARKRNGFIVEDNYDSELTVSKKNDDTIFALSGQEKVIYLNTFSHTIAPSIRVGYMVLPEDMLSEFERKLGFYSCTVPVFEQYVLAELLQSGDFERHINRVRRKKRKNSI